MEKLKNFLIILLFTTLPFEKALTFDVAGFTLKLPYLTAIMLLAYLGYKTLFRKKKIILNIVDYFLIAFIVNSFLTTFWSIDKPKTVIISTMYLFCASVYFAVKNLANETLITRIKYWFIYLGIATSIFAFWQFFADGFGISQKYTLLSQLYVSGVFGFPRVQSTFFEPGFFAKIAPNHLIAELVY